MFVDVSAVMMTGVGIPNDPAANMRVVVAMTRQVRERQGSRCRDKDAERKKHQPARALHGDQRWCFRQAPALRHAYSYLGSRAIAENILQDEFVQSTGRCAEDGCLDCTCG